ncbi:MAG: peptidylprolyl isomerase, partial [Balneolaceae bacterium]
THAQSKHDRTVVGTVGKEKVTYAEVKNNFSSGSNNSFSIDELESFLPLYLDYKAKLLSAKDQDYYSDSALVAEHNLYAKQAAYAFWLENEIRPTVFKEYYNRATTELKSFHILVGVGENPSPEEVDNAKMKLAQAKADIKNEIPLAEVDKKYSTTRGGRSMGGDLPWLSAGRTVREFEDQLYSLQIGEISEPFATQFGYHIVLLQEKRERTPARLTNHIFVRPTQDSAAYKKIYEAYNHLDEGRSWNEVMMQYSEDDASKGNNGNIGWVSYHSNFAGDFIDVVNNFDASLDFSEPVRTNYGFHIFKVDSVQTYASEEERKDEVRAEMKRSNYYKEDNAFVVNYLKNKFGAEEFPESGKAYKDFITGLDSTLISNVTTLPFSLSSQKIFGFNGQEYTVAEYHSYLGEVEGNRMARQYR